MNNTHTMSNAPFEQKQRAFKQADIRFLILHTLRYQPGYLANQEVLLFTLRELGHAISHEQLHDELAWLDQTANALVNKAAGPTHVARLTTVGLDVVEGTCTIPGIRPPLPHEIHIQE